MFLFCLNMCSITVTEYFKFKKCFLWLIENSNVISVTLLSWVVFPWKDRMQWFLEPQSFLKSMTWMSQNQKWSTLTIPRLYLVILFKSMIQSLHQLVMHWCPTLLLSYLGLNDGMINHFSRTLTNLMEFRSMGKLTLDPAGQQHWLVPRLSPEWTKPRVNRRLEKNCQIFQRITQKVGKSKKGQNIYNKAQFESPKHLHQTTFETLKYLHQTMFWNCLFREKCNKSALTKSGLKSGLKSGHYFGLLNPFKKS